MQTVVIIGTQPPCPRCKLLTSVLFKKVIEFKIQAEVKHLAYTDSEAKEYANNLGLVPGTAKDVAKRANLRIDSDKIDSIIQNSKLSKNTEFKELNDCNWSYELDEYLRPFQQLANEVGILMTPALIINGDLKHWGSVPKLDQIEYWLHEMQN